MLRKLIKYDLKDIFKGLVIFYGLSVFFSILTRMFLSIDNSFVMNIIGKICGGIVISMIFNIIINNLIRMWVRFKNNLYGDESYLTHTLPIEKEKIYLSKIFVSVISLFVSILVIGISLFISYYSKENIEIVKNILFPIADVLNSSIFKILLLLLFILFLQFSSMLQVGYTGIILGHRKNNFKVGFSVLFALGTYIGFQLLMLLIVFIYALFNNDVMNLFYTNEIINVNVIMNVIYLCIFLYCILLFINSIINISLFKKGVNVE